MRKLVLFTSLVLGVCLCSVLGSAAPASVSDEPNVLIFLKKYGTPVCEDSNVCLYIGPIINAAMEIRLEDGKTVFKPATFQVELWRKEGSNEQELRAQVRVVSAVRINAEVPDLLLMVDRGADLKMDAAIYVPFATNRNAAGEYFVSALPQECWDRSGFSFCSEPMPEADQKSFAAAFRQAVDVTVKYYTDALAMERKSR
jgi:hypothetical protein